MNKYLLLAALVGFSCGSKPAPESGATLADNKLETKADARVQVEAFNNVDKTRHELSKVGIGELGSWRDDEMGGFMSITSYFPFGASGLNNLAYYLESDNRDYVRTLKLVLNINNRAEKRDAVDRLSEVTEKTFKAISLPLPVELVNSIKAEKPTVVDGENFVSELKLEKSNINSWIVKITAKK